MTRHGPIFALTTLAPALLIVLGAWLGGAWAHGALAWMTILALVLDECVALAGGEGRAAQEFPAARGLNLTLGLAHFCVLGATIPALAGAARLDGAEWIAVLVATGLWLGQVSNANAHELLHAPARGLRRLGRWVYISVLFGHHASSHLLVHHVHAASAQDPNSARLGRSYYRFLPDAWAGSFRAGLREETMRHGWTPGHPYLHYGGGAILALGGAWLLGGGAGVLVFAFLALWAQAQLLLSDYVQHYGLRRAIGPDGRTEPVRATHSWNAPHWFSNYLMVNAPRHSDHHTHPARSFPTLTIPPADTVPTLPFSLPVMGLIALVPPLWRHIMDPRAAAWSEDAQDWDIAAQ